MTNELDLTHLRAVAEAATPGPWIIDSLESGEHGVFVEESNPDYRKLGCASAIVASHLVGKNAEYLEAFDPDTVLALLSRLEQAERNADTYQTLYEQRAESLEQAEQAVARVRAVCELDAYEVSNEFGDYDAVAVEDILDALDGES